MRSDHPDFEGGLDPRLADVDNQLHLFFRQAAQPAVPPALAAATERLPRRRFGNRIGFATGRLFARPMRAGLVALSLVLAIAIAAGLLALRGGSNMHGGPSAQTSATASAATPSGSTTSSPAPSESPSSVASVESGPAIGTIGRLDSKTGWVTIEQPDGATYLRWTADGGKSWSEPRELPSGVALGSTNPVQFVDAQHGWARFGLVTATAVTNFVWRTTDGGLTWQSSSFVVATTPGLGGTFTSSLHFRDSLHGEDFEVHGPTADLGVTPGSSPEGFVCQRFSTSDGGVTWSAPKAMPCLSGPEFVDGRLGYASDVFASPVLYVTADGGQTWTTGTLPPNARGSATPYYAALLERHADGTLRALAMWGNGGAPVRAIIVSGDAGKTWTMAGTPSGIEAVGGPVAALDESHWIASGMGSDSNKTDLLVTGDGGLTWTPVQSTGITGYLSSLDFVNATDGWAVTNPFETTAALWATTDGGVRWTRILKP
jgi:hypothetical protein